MNIAGLIKELKKEKDQVQRHLAGIDSALAAFAGAYTKTRRRKMSAAARAKIAAAQRARWAKFRRKRRNDR